MKEITVDCRNFVSRSDLHQAFAQALSFPDWYGNNLDALYDQLTSIGAETALRLLHWAEAEAAMGRYATCARRAIEDAAQQNPKLTVLFE